MSLEGAKLICLNANDNDQFETIPAHGKSFKFGYYMNCDVVLEHPDAIGVQCVIECDAFGRVTIENRFTDQPITLDGKTLGKMRPLLHNTEICILGKKYMWQFEGNPHLKSFQMEDINDFVTPVKKNIKPQQAPNSEPTRKWRRQFQNRLTIHSFAYCIKAGESPQDVNITTDENKPLNIHERITDADTDIVQNKILSTSQATVPDFIDLNSPKMGQGSFGLRRTTLSCCNLSETVITSYSPRETGIRQEKSFAVVQSPLAAVKMKTTDVSFGPFNHTDSPQTILNPRPSMHLIDLTTPMKLIPAVSSPMKTLLKSTLKSNLLKGTSPRTPQKTRKVMDLSSTASVETVYSVRSTDDESVIIVSDDASSPTSPIAKTPPRARTPQSLMKRAILSSAKKAAVTKKLLNLAAPKQMQVLITPKNPATIRFQSQSTPQRKSFGRLPSSAESLSAGKSRKSMITSTPFRRGEDIIPSSSKLLSTANSQSPSVGIARKESRNSLMLRQALSMTSAQNLTKKRKSVSSLHVEHKPKKSVSFFEKIKKGEQTHTGGVEVVSKLNDTFSIEEKEEVLSTCKDASVLPDKEQNQNLDTFQTKPLKQTQGMPKQEVSKVLLQHKTNSFSENQCLQVLPETDLQYDSLIESIDKAPFKVCTDHENSSLVENTSTDSKQIDPEVHKQFEVKQTTQSSGHGLEINENDNKTLNTCDDNEYDIEGMDEIFKTPKAKNLMILSSPKSISLQKSSPDSVELVHSTEFDLSANLDELFQTPQSELLNSHVDAEAPTALPASFEALSPEEAFDLLIGRPAYKKSYARKTPQTKHELSLLKMSNDPNFPKTDIEEWIDSVNDSIELMEGAQDEDEMTFLTTAMGEFSRDPLIMNSVIENSNAKKCPIFSKTPKDELEMSIQEGDGEKNKSNITIRKDPLELTVPRPLSPNISGIDLLDHTSESIFSETLAVSDDSSIKEVEKAMTVPDANDQNDVIIGILKQPCKAHEDKARSEIEEAFKKFENERRILEGKRLVSTPEAKKTSISKFALRRSMGDCSLKDENIDFKAFDSTHSEKSNLESIGFKLNEQVQAVLPINKIEANFENCSNLLQESLVSIKDKFVSETPGNQRDINEGFENIEQVSEFLLNETNSKHKPKIMLLAKHTIKCPDSDLSVDDQSIEQTFSHFGEEPAFSIKRVLKSPEPEKITRKEYGKTIGTSLVPEVKIDWQAAKAERDLKLAFTNFEEHPDFSVMRVVKTPQLTEAKTKDHRRTLGTALMSERRLDLNAAKAERELELAFKNFEEQPEYSVKRIVKTPEPNKSRTKDHRRTLGTAMVSEVKFDLKAAKAERELEMAIEHFEKEPEFSGKRAVKTPELPKVTTKDHRRTLGTALIPEGKLDLKATKAERELELAFKNFEEEPEFSVKRVVKTPDPNRVRTEDHRRTLGTAMMCEVKFDLKAARAERELELAFENFKETPHVSGKREVKTPEPTKMTMKDRRRTLGTAFIPEEKVDLKAAKAERELELAFQNFEGQPDFSVKRVIKTPEPNKSKMKDHRRTLGTAMVSEVKFDLKAAKAERELELAFENFKEKPHVSGKREVKTPEPTKVTMKDHRRTLGTAFIPEVKIDLKAAKAERELKLAFEHFEEEPEISGKREVKTPEHTKATTRDHRRTLGTALISEGKLDLKAAKAERELELAFKNFEEQPDFSVKRVIKTPEPNKSKMKDHRRTLGTAMVSEVKFDLKAAKAERELELAFENFKEKPHVPGKREVKTPEPTKVTMKDHRRTLGTAFIPEGKIDLKAAKAERELKLAFEHFKEEPEISGKREVKTPEPTKETMRDHRRTLGTALISEGKLDLKAAKAERELELAFKNFEEQPDFSVKRVIKTPEPNKSKMKDHRRTLGTAMVSEVKFDLKAAKAERELELAFENFKEKPHVSGKREVKTPEPTKVTMKDHRRTLGTAFIPEGKIDLKAAKAERELKLAFEHFEEEPEISGKREVKTPEPTKATMRDHRRTLGTAFIPEGKVDLKAAKAERELELAFQNFEGQPDFSVKRVIKTPEPNKSKMKDHRRTLGTAMVSEVKFDLKAAKAERELELAFENFKEKPHVSGKREVKTPEPTKVKIKDHRRTLGTALIPEGKLDLKAAKAEHELELAFKNFKEQPEFSVNRTVKTPEHNKARTTDHRRTLGTALVTEVKLDLNAANAARELEIAFENFEEKPDFSVRRVVKTPEPTKVTTKDHRRNLCTALISELKHDSKAVKAERELQLASETPKLDKSQVKEITRAEDEDCKSEVLKTLDRENDSDNEIFVKSENNKTNEIVLDHQIDPQNNLLQQRMCQNSKSVTPKSKILRSTPSRRTRQNSVDTFIYDAKNPGVLSRKALMNSFIEDESINKFALCLESTDVNSTESKPNQMPTRPRGKRIRKKTSEASEISLEIIDAHCVLELNLETKFPNKHAEEKSVINLRTKPDKPASLAPNQSQKLKQMRKTRQNSIDTFKADNKIEINAFVLDSAEENIAQTNEVETKSSLSALASDQIITVTPVALKTLKQMRRTRQNSVDMATDVDIESSDLSTSVQVSFKGLKKDEVKNKSYSRNVDSTDDAARQKKFLRNTRISKKAIQFVDTPLKETGVDGSLECVVEEERNIDVKSGNKEKEITSIISCKGETEEIIAKSPFVPQSHIRGRRAHLTVVLSESKNANHQTLKELSEDNGLNDEQSERNDMENDISESIPPTPVSTNSRGRRPQNKIQTSTPKVPALEKTRISSIDEHAEIKQSQIDKIAKQGKQNDADKEDDLKKDESFVLSKTLERKLGTQNGAPTNASYLDNFPKSEFEHTFLETVAPFVEEIRTYHKLNCDSEESSPALLQKSRNCIDAGEVPNASEHATSGRRGRRIKPVKTVDLTTENMDALLDRDTMTKKRGRRAGVNKESVLESIVEANSRIRNSENVVEVLLPGEEEQKKDINDLKTTASELNITALLHSTYEEKDVEKLSQTKEFNEPKRSHKRAAQKGDVVEKEVISKKRTRNPLLRQEVESLNESETREENVSLLLKGDNTPARKRIRKAPKKLAEFVVSNLVQPVKIETCEYKCESSVILDSPSVSKKRGRPAKTTSEKVESNQECMTPVSKRGRRGMIVHLNNEDSTPSDYQKTRKISQIIATSKLESSEYKCENSVIFDSPSVSKKRGRPAKKTLKKDESMTPDSKHTRKGIFENEESTSSRKEDHQKALELSEAACTRDDKHVSISVRNTIINSATEPKEELKNTPGKEAFNKVVTLSTEKPSVSVSEEKPIASDVTTRNKPTRSREKGVLKNDSKEDISKHTEDAQPVEATKPKLIHNRKAVIEENISIKEKIIQEPAQNSNRDLENSSNNDTEEKQAATTVKPKSNKSQTSVKKVNISTESRLIQEPEQSSNLELEICSKKQSIITEESQSEVSHKPRSTRNRKAAIKESIQTEEKPIKKTAQNANIDLQTNKESVVPEGTQVAATTKLKSNRTQKVVDKANISTEARLIKEPKQSSNPEFEICSKKESVVTEESQSVVATKPRSTRNRKAVIKEKIPIEEKPIKETAKHLKLKLETISNIDTFATEETQVATTTKPKSNRTQKVVDKANISTQARLIQEPEQNSNLELEICSKKESVVTEESQSVVAIKPRSTRNRTAVIREKIPIEEKPIKETAKHLKLKLETISNIETVATEETQVATTNKPKSNRTQTIVDKANISTEARLIQEPEQSSNPELKICFKKESVVTEESHTAVATKPRSTRNRKAVIKEKIPIEEEPIKETEETHVATTTKPKSNRTQKGVKKANTSTEAKFIQESALNSNTELEVSSNKEEEAQPVVATKPRSNRYRKAVTHENISIEDKPIIETTQISNTELDTSSSKESVDTEKTQVAATTIRKTNRAQKVVKKANISTDAKVIQEKARNSNNEVNTSSNNELVVSEEAQPVVAPKPRSNRVQKAVIKENISMDEKLDKKTAQLLNTELEEEARPVATTKLNLNRGRKATTSTEIKNTQEPAQHSNIELEISSDKASVNIKPKRGKRLATADMDNNKALVTIEHSIPIKKLVRSRTPAPSAAKESNDNMLQLESSPQPPLQSGKVSDVNTKIVPKRHILEIQANDERNDDTPSKRTRRKPRKFL